ncbi:hypothetical protein L208DRAFT_1404160 [Tricholoma matsutake]|nr:hypothetical protein L208DRAFT_1404160 [Tricholoma matsutake 945]
MPLLSVSEPRAASNRLLTATRDDNSGGLSSLMRGGCEENEGDEEVAVNCAPCTTASDLTGLPVDRLSDVGEGTRHAQQRYEWRSR